MRKPAKIIVFFRSFNFQNRLCSACHCSGRSGSDDDDGVRRIGMGKGKQSRTSEARQKEETRHKQSVYKSTNQKGGDEKIKPGRTKLIADFDHALYDCLSTQALPGFGGTNIGVMFLSPTTNIVYFPTMCALCEICSCR